MSKYTPKKVVEARIKEQKYLEYRNRLLSLAVEIPKGFRRLRAGTRLKKGDRFEWDGNWYLAEIFEDGNYAANPYTYIRKKS